MHHQRDADVIRHSSVSTVLDIGSDRCVPVQFSVRKDVVVMFWRMREMPSEMLADRARKALQDVTKRAQQVQLRREERRPRGLLPGLLLGITAGITAGLLFAPQKGVQTRAFVRERWTDYTKDLPETASTVAETTRGFGDRIMQMFTARPTKTRRRTTKS